MHLRFVHDTPTPLEFLPLCKSMVALMVDEEYPDYSARAGLVDKQLVALIASILLQTCAWETISDIVDVDDSSIKTKIKPVLQVLDRLLPRLPEDVARIHEMKKRQTMLFDLVWKMPKSLQCYLKMHKFVDLASLLFHSDNVDQWINDRHIPRSCLVKAISSLTGSTPIPTYMDVLVFAEELLSLQTMADLQQVHMMQVKHRNRLKDIIEDVGVEKDAYKPGQKFWDELVQIQQDVANRYRYAEQDRQARVTAASAGEGLGPHRVTLGPVRGNPKQQQRSPPGLSEVPQQQQQAWRRRV